MTVTYQFVSICIPAYNSSDYIKETITTLLDQTYSNLKIIVVDDGSIGYSLQVFKSVQDQCLKYISKPIDKNPKNDNTVVDVAVIKKIVENIGLKY